MFDDLPIQTIARDEQTLAGLLKATGYATGAVVAGPWMMSIFGLNKGFDFYDEQNIVRAGGRNAEDVTLHALKWLERPNDKPRFLFLNYFDPHDPYNAPDDYVRMFLGKSAPDPDIPLTRLPFETRVALYDAEIRFMDHHVGRLLDGMKRLGLYDRALIIFTADHGELLGEHGQIGHGEVPFQEVVGIPMIVKQPGRQEETGRSRQWIQLTDILPLILSRLDLPIPENIQGSVPPDTDHPILIESVTVPEINKRGDWLSLIEDGFKLMLNSQGNHMLFDLHLDPGEQKNLFTRQIQKAHEMRGRLEDYVVSLPKPGSQASPIQGIDSKTRETLKSLGYVD